MYHIVPNYLKLTFFKERASTLVVFRGTPQAAQFQIGLLKPKNFNVMPKVEQLW
jgi:hypothetical protein